MSLVKPISLGQVVESITGRDYQKLYVVVGIQNRNVFVSDGRNKPVRNPKKKNIRHVRALNRVSSLVADKLNENLKVTDEEIRGVLNICKKNNL